MVILVGEHQERGLAPLQGHLDLCRRWQETRCHNQDVRIDLFQFVQQLFGRLRPAISCAGQKGGCLS